MPFYARLLLLFALAAQAAFGADDVYVPDELRDWQAWVLDGKEYRNCPFYFERTPRDRGDYVCAWPETLDIVVDRAGAQFTQRWGVGAADSWLPLPGDRSYWPDDVTANGASVSVVEHNGMPSVRMPPGNYVLRGRFEWDERPGSLPIPPQSGLVTLTVNGQRIARPELGRDGVFLGERQTETQARDTVQTQVYRLVADDVPTRLVTVLEIDVSGSVREELFGPVLPDGFVPLSIRSVLPAKLEADGRLRVQVRPGRWEVWLSARAAGVLNAVVFGGGTLNLPDDEIWSYRGADRLRVTAAEGLAPVDPLRVEVPGDWAELPAFRITKGETLVITERSRGLVSADNDLGLRRKIWLDFDGAGFVARDALGGTMRRDWRLDMRPPFRLESATSGGENLLVTKGQEPGWTGIELREPNLDALTLARSESGGRMPVTGWDARFANVDARLYLPPGYKLLAAPGVDSATGSWAGQWQLLDFFLVLIITVAAWKLFGRKTGVVALLALALSYQELNAPAWLWLNLLIAIALLRVAPDGRLRAVVRTYLGASALLLVLALVPFVADQLRIAIYPQLEPQVGVLHYARTADEFAPVTAPSTPELRMEMDAVRKPAAVTAERAAPLEEIVATGSKIALANFARYAPNAIVQAGSGIPSWQWNAYRLNWSGPVDAGQSMRLVIGPRWLVTALRFVEVLLLVLFTALLAAEILKQRWPLPKDLGMGRGTATGLAAGVVGSMMLASAEVRAQTPDPEILRELERRLLEPPDCVPRCAEIAAADVAVDGNTVRIRLAINAIESVAVPLPGSPRGWRPDAVIVEGSASAQVLRGADQSLWLRVPSGRQSVVVRGATGGADSIEIGFPAPPRVVTATGNGWFIAGIKDRRLLSGALQLTRLRTGENGDGAPRWESSRFPAFVEVERSIELGLDWRVTTTVTRIAPEQGALSLNLPLLPGESVLTADMGVSDGRILVSMNPTTRQVSWESNLPRTSPLVLTAEAGAAWTETWYVGVGTLWHADFSGVPESESGFPGAGVRMAEFHPRGGETLEIVASRPEAAEGSTLAFDSIDVRTEQGAGSRSSTLALGYRSTRGAQHVVRLPPGAEITNAVIDGNIVPMRADDGALTLPILPGEHTISVDWRETGEIGWRSVTPAIDVGAPASNISLTLTLPESRWLLATRGPRLGPAVLYWSELAVLVLLALLLGRVALTPLETRHWLLLGLGFSTFNWPVLGLVALWLLTVGARDKWRAEEPAWRYNFKQATVLTLSIVALVGILYALPTGLLGTPDMHVVGNDSYGNRLSWFADRSESAIPRAQAISVPLWVYSALILAWAMWFSLALLKWLPWTWRCFARDGFFHSDKHDRGQSDAGPE